MRVKEDGKTLEITENSWHNLAHVIYLDSPVGTGLSFVSDPSSYAVSEDDLASDSEDRRIRSAQNRGAAPKKRRRQEASQKRRGYDFSAAKSNMAPGNVGDFYSWP